MTRRFRVHPIVFDTNAVSLTESVFVSVLLNAFALSPLFGVLGPSTF